MNLKKDVYTVPEFCESHGFSRAFFYKLLKEGNGPKLMRLRKRVFITKESAKEWRLKMENQTKENYEPTK
jgi:predicted DNA-binding transcriptional regulator AlpA